MPLETAISATLITMIANSCVVATDVVDSGARR
jgi:hypothetical protein